MSELSREAENLLGEASAWSGRDAASILDAVLGIGFLHNDPVAAGHLQRADTDVSRFVLDLDHTLRLRNPGLQYVVRNQFIGYRRSGRRGTTPAAERSDIFLSLVIKRAHADVYLPLDPSDYSQNLTVTDKRGIGHHGVGDLCVTLTSDEGVRQLVADFDEWLSGYRSSSST